MAKSTHPLSAFLSHTTITFQSGYHKVNYSYNVLIRNARNITLLGDVHDHSVIQCAGGFGLSFMNVTNLTISNLNFQLCGAPILERQIVYVPNFLQVVNYIATLHLIQASGVKISNTQ